MSESKADYIRNWRSEHASVESPPTEYSAPGTERNLKSRIAAWLPALYLPLMILVCIAYAWRPLGGGDDIWAHAAVGRWMWGHMEVPRQTLFLWGTPPVPWIAQQWLSQLLFYFLLQSGGPFFAVLFTVAMVTLTFLLLWRLWLRHAPINVFTPLLFAVGIYAGSLRFRPRPELFTAFFLVITIAYLAAWSQKRIEAWQDAPRSPQFLDGATFVLLFMFALWANLHGAVAMGVLVVLLTAFCDVVQDRFDARSRSLLCIAALCVLATFINPNGIGLWNEILRPAGSETFKNIDEWKPPLQARVLWSYAFGELVLVLAALAVWRLNPQRRWSQAAWLLVMTLMFLRYRRHLWLFALVSLAVLAINARYINTERMWDWWRKITRQPRIALPQPFRIIARSSVVLCLVLWIALATPSNIWPLRATTKNLPEGAARFVEAKKLRGRLFNDYENSSYLQWRLNGPLQSGPNRGRVLARGRRPLYIDLLNAYPDTLLKDYLSIMDSDATGRAHFEKLDLGYVVLGSEKRKNKLAKYLNRNPQWARVYDAKDGVVWVRRAVNPSVR
ncbi:MAG TPA: hypothetical protein VF600_03940 [Abditibacteriaceae bacterium]